MIWIDKSFSNSAVLTPSLLSTLLLSRELIGHLSLLRARRKWKLAAATLQQALNWPKDIPLYLHQHSGPSTVGWLRPVVILPQRLLSDLSSTAISQVAQHELAHARWRDPLANAVLRIMRALLWPSLPLWFLEHLIYTEREAAADQAAIADGAAHPGSKQSALDYVASLLSIAEWEDAAPARSFIPLGAQVGGKKVLEKRVSRLLTTSPRLHAARAALGLAALLGGLMTMGWLPVAVADQSAKESQAAAKPQAAKRENYPAIPNKESVAGRATLSTPPAPQEIKKLTPARSERETPTSSPKDMTPPDPQNRIIFNRDWVGSAVLIHQTEAGEIEEPILPQSEAQLKAAALQQVIPAYPEGIVSDSPLPGSWFPSWLTKTAKSFQRGPGPATKTRSSNSGP